MKEELAEKRWAEKRIGTSHCRECWGPAWATGANKMKLLFMAEVSHVNLYLGSALWTLACFIWIPAWLVYVFCLLSFSAVSYYCILLADCWPSSSSVLIAGIFCFCFVSLSLQLVSSHHSANIFWVPAMGPPGTWPGTGDLAVNHLDISLLSWSLQSDKAH